MPRDGAGNYTLPAGNPVASGTVVTSTWANTTLDDVAVALTDSLDRYGRGGMQVPFRFADGTVNTPGMGWSNEQSSGFYRAAISDMRVAILGQDLFRWFNDKVFVWADGAWREVAFEGGRGVLPEGTTEGQALYWNNTLEAWNATDTLFIDNDNAKVGVGVLGLVLEADFTVFNSSSTRAWSASAAVVQLLERSTDTAIDIVSGSFNNGVISFGDAEAEAPGQIVYNHLDDQMELWANTALAQKIDNGGGITFPALASPAESTVGVDVDGKLILLPVASGSTQTTVTQLAHGFAPLDCIHHNGTDWELALADDVATTAHGVVVEVEDVDTFTWAITGRAEVAAHGLNVGAWYWLSDTVPGGVQLTPPAVEQPVFYIEGIDHVIIYEYRPSLAEPVTALPTYARKNLLINGDFSVWQRGTSFGPTAAAYTADRWRCHQTNTNQQTGSDGKLHMLCQASATAPNVQWAYQGVENGGTDLQGEQITISVDAEWLSGNVVNLVFSTDEGGSFYVQPLAYSGTSRQTVTVTVTVPASTTADNHLYVYMLSDDAVVNDAVRIYNIQLELGDTATDFEYVNATDQLTRCQRYYFALSKGGQDYWFLAVGNSDGDRNQSLWHPVTMRATPTTTLAANIGSVAVIVAGPDGSRCAVGGLSTGSAVTTTSYTADAEL